MPGRVIVVMPDDWIRVLLRAELIEEGYDAIGSPSLADAESLPARDRRGGVRLILVDQAAVSANEASIVERLFSKHDHPPMVLLGSALASRPDGPWQRVVQRPASIAEIVATIAKVIAEKDRRAKN